ncbi:MAG: hypothetical protein HYX74_00745 [Acidobacteria bacterium]|nr:hypothetical protein [Acidobacteriota bacterium]
MSNRRSNSGVLQVSRIGFLLAAFFLAGTPASPGVIRGVVALDGAPPPPRGIDPTTDAHVCESYQFRPVVVGREGGIENVVVYLADAVAGQPYRAESAVVDQKGCRFIPHLLLVPAGQTVTFRNSDSVTHNIHSSGEGHRGINKFQPVGVELALPLPRPGIVRVRCDIHYWMEMYIVAARHAFYKTTDSRGEFVLEGIQPGTYTLEAWHPELEMAQQHVTVKLGETAQVQLEMRVRK